LDYPLIKRKEKKLNISSPLQQQQQLERRLAMEAAVIDAGTQLLKAGTAVPDQAPPMVTIIIPPLP
jgi:hypothetical protein